MPENILLTFISMLLLLSGLYFLIGLCCKGNFISRIAGGIVSLAGLAGLLLSVVPC